MSSLSEQMRNDAARVSAALREAFSCPPACEPFHVLYEAMCYSADGGGKRIRPFLTLAFCRLYGGTEAAAMPWACALECVHTYSLIHDDLPCMDNDDFRRGKPTNHKAFGEATALLAGDGLLTAAFGIAAGNLAVKPEQTVRAIQLLSEMAGPAGMVGGQQMDLMMDGKAGNMAQLEQMERLKCGCLIRAGCMLGALAAGVTDLTVADTYGSCVGLAFQIMDDVLDAEEVEEGKVTYLSFLTEAEARAYAAALTEKAIAAVRQLPGSETLVALAEYLVRRDT